MAGSPTVLCTEAVLLPLRDHRACGGESNCGHTVDHILANERNGRKHLGAISFPTQL